MHRRRRLDLLCYNVTLRTTFALRRSGGMVLQSVALRVAAVATLMGVIAASAQAQVALPEIRVTAPSPIVRPAPSRDVTTSEAPPAELQGTLPVVTDQFATVTVVPNAELRRNGAATLGDLLFDKPGITGSSFAPGASSRPIIRGLDVNRVRIQEDGIGANGASDLGEDHFVPVDPLTTNQVEVIRGPATLRFGSQAIGGVVEKHQQPHPDTCIPPRGFSAGTARAAANLGRQRPRWRGAARRRRRQFRDPRRCLRPQGRRLPRAALSLSDAAQSGRRAERDAARRLQRPAAELVAAQRRPVGRRLLYLQRRLRRRRGDAERRALSYPRHRRRRTPYPHRRAPDQGTQQGRMARARSRRSTRSGSGAASPTTSTTKSGWPTIPTSQPTASGRPSPTRSRRAASKRSSRRSICASRR